MVAVGGGEAVFSYVGDGTTTAGLQQALITNEAGDDSSGWGWVPIIGTGMTIIKAGKDCWAAAQAQW